MNYWTKENKQGLKDCEQAIIKQSLNQMKLNNMLIEQSWNQTMCLIQTIQWQSEEYFCNEANSHLMNLLFWENSNVHDSQ